MDLAKCQEDQSEAKKGQGEQEGEPPLSALAGDGGHCNRLERAVVRPFGKEQAPAHSGF